MDRRRSSDCSTTDAEVTVALSLSGSLHSLLTFRYSEGEIHFSLMAVVSELRRKYERELEQVSVGETPLNDNPSRVPILRWLNRSSIDRWWTKCQNLASLRVDPRRRTKAWIVSSSFRSFLFALLFIVVLDLRSKISADDIIGCLSSSNWSKAMHPKDCSSLLWIRSVLHSCRIGFSMLSF